MAKMNSQYPLATDIASDVARPAHCVEGCPEDAVAGRLPAETLEEIIGNLALLPVAREAIWKRYQDGRFTDDGLEQQWTDIGTHISVMQLDLTDRMLKEERHRIDTGQVQAILEFDTSLKGRYVAVLYRGGKKVV